jgi:hypothetical protein
MIGGNLSPLLPQSVMLSTASQSFSSIRPEGDHAPLRRPHPTALLRPAFPLLALFRQFITQRLPSDRAGLFFPHSASDRRHLLVQCLIDAIPMGWIKINVAVPARPQMPRAAATPATVHPPRGPTETGSRVTRIPSEALMADRSLRVLCDWVFVMVAVMLWE